MPVVPARPVEVKPTIEKRPAIFNPPKEVNKVQVEEEPVPVAPTRTVIATPVPPRPSPASVMPPRASPPVSPTTIPSSTRIWKDASGSFTIQAAYLGYEDGTVLLHKSNGVKIGVGLELSLIHI